MAYVRLTKQAKEAMQMPVENELKEKVTMYRSVSLGRSIHYPFYICKRPEGEQAYILGGVMRRAHDGTRIADAPSEYNGWEGYATKGGLVSVDGRAVNRVDFTPVSPIGRLFLTEDGDIYEAQHGFVSVKHTLIRNYNAYLAYCANPANNVDSLVHTAYTPSEHKKTHHCRRRWVKGVITSLHLPGDPIGNLRRRADKHEDAVKAYNKLPSFIRLMLNPFGLNPSLF